MAFYENTIIAKQDLAEKELKTIKKLKINSLGLEDSNGDKIYYEYY